MTIFITFAGQWFSLRSKGNAVQIGNSSRCCKSNQPPRHIVTGPFREDVVCADKSEDLPLHKHTTACGEWVTVAVFFRRLQTPCAPLTDDETVSINHNVCTDGLAPLCPTARQRERVAPSCRPRHHIRTPHRLIGHPRADTLRQRTQSPECQLYSRRHQIFLRCTAERLRRHRRAQDDQYQEHGQSARGRIL